MRNLLFGFLLLSLVCSAYLKKTKDLDAQSERPFRSGKATLIWAKAQKQLLGQKARLQDLKDELKVMDAELMNLKHAKVDNRDPYGDMENSIAEKIEALLSKYDMGGKFDKETKNRSNRVEDSSHHEEELQAILNRAHALGFSDEDLADLNAEAEHHRRKMRELDSLEEELKRAQQKLLSQRNELDPDRMKDPMTVERITDMKDNIKTKRRELEDGRSRLSLIADVPSFAKNSTFTQTKVIRLWADILRANFTDEERESLKEELTHLENKILKREKMASHMTQIKKSQLQAKKEGSTADGEHYIEKHKQLLEKSDYLDRHVAKYEKDIKARISARKYADEL